MKPLSCCSLFLSALLLAACGGGSDSLSTPATAQATTTAATATPPPTPTPTPTLSSVAQAVEYYGDSTIRGYESGTGAQVATSAPEAFAAALPASPKQGVSNLGVDGQTACMLLNAGWENRMALSKATIVIFNHGINDAAAGDIDAYKACLTALAATAKNHGKRVIFETPNPVDNANIQLDKYVLAMKEVASRDNAPVIDQFAFLSQSGRSFREMCPDGTHPSQAVYIEKGQFAASVYVKIPL